MKMRIINILMLFLIITACNDDFMERYPLDAINDENFWRNASDLELYNNSLYDTYLSGHGKYWANKYNDPIGYMESFMVYGDEISDNMTTSGSTKYKVKEGKYIIPTASGKGGWNWENLRKLNFFLVNYEKSEIPRDEGNVYAGEIMFFKAMEYFNKVKLFGDVPYYTTPLNPESEELYSERTSRKVVMDSVLMLINKAIDYLPEKGNEKADRLNRDAALHFKARICLHEGTFRKYHNLGDSESFIREAENAAGELINSQRYSIVQLNDADPYYQMFAQYDYRNNSEVIFARHYDDELIGHATSRYWNYNIRRRGIGATKDLADTYLCDDGLPISSSSRFLGHDIQKDEMTNRDPRMSQTICAPGDNYVFSRRSNPFQRHGGLNGAGGTSCNTGYRVIKWWVNDPVEYSRVYMGILAAPIFRYAETLLIYAEAKAELGECDQTILDQTVNQLRSRVGMVHLNASVSFSDPLIDNTYIQYADYTITPLLREIRRERRVELACEGYRYDDLMRWKLGRFFTKPIRGIKFNQAEYLEYEKNPNTGEYERVPDDGPNNYNGYKVDVLVGQDIYLDNEGFVLPRKPAIYPDNYNEFDSDKDYYFPIPIEDLVMNSNLKQNPGWKDAGSLTE